MTTYALAYAAIAAVCALAFACGFGLALSLVGYGVRGGISQIIRLRTYRLGNCACALCQPDKQVNS